LRRSPAIDSPYDGRAVSTKGGKMNDKIKSYRDLNVWKKGKQIILDIYKATKGFPQEENQGLTTQMRRSAIMIATNIAGGYNRKNNGDYKQFISFALGSCAELETQIEIASALGMLGEDIATGLYEKLDHECRMLRNLAKKIDG
jgi:four helix bundle protein